MKLSGQEEYGMRCLLRIAREGEGGSLTIPEISQAEGISSFYAAKLMRLLRCGGFVKSARGQVGGYSLARPADQIRVGEVLAAIGGRLFETDFCDSHTGIEKLCTNSVDCSVRWLWRSMQLVLDQFLTKLTLKDLVSNEEEMTSRSDSLIQVSGLPVKSPHVPAGPGQ